MRYPTSNRQPRWLPFRYTLTVAPRLMPLEGLPQKMHMTVAGLNELDARLELNKQLFKKGLKVWAILDVEELPVPMPWRKCNAKAQNQ